MNMKSIIGFLVCLLSMQVNFACEPDRVICRQATMSDAADIVQLIDTHGIQDANKIVILPTLFRLQAIQAAIGAGKIFVAHDTQTDQLIGFKKLFVLQDQQEQNEVLTDEIRCIGDKRVQIDTSFFEYQDNHVAKKSQLPITDFQHQQNAVHIYNGGDFTHPDFRGQGINKRLTDTALAHIKRDVTDRVQHAPYLALVYGLTHFNDYQQDGSGYSRTPSIVSSLVPFAQQIKSDLQNDSVTCYRYQAFMPTFDVNAEACVPLPDNQSVSGFGNVLLYNMR